MFGFCLALVAYNVLAVVLAVLRGVHGQQTVDEEVSLYSLANEVAATLLDLAQRVNLRALRKSPRGPKKPPPKRDGNSKQGHVSTAKLLTARHG